MSREFYIPIRERKLPKDLEQHWRTIRHVGRQTLNWFLDELSKIDGRLKPVMPEMWEAQLSLSERLYAGALRLSQILSQQAVDGKRFNSKRSVWFNKEMGEMLKKAKGIFTPQTLAWQLDGIVFSSQRGGLKEVYSAYNPGIKGQFDGVIHDVLLSATSLNLGAEFPYTAVISDLATQMGIGDNFCLPYHPGISQIFGAEFLASLYPNLKEVYFFAESSGTAVNSAAIEAVCAYAENIFPDRFPKVLQIDGTWCGGLGTAKEGTGFGVALQVEKRGGPLWVERCLPLPTAENRELFLRIVREKIENGEAAGVLLEPIVGDAGIVPADPQLVKELVQLLEKGANGYSLPIIVDTVQQGSGRTGEYWGIEHLPDLAKYPLLVLTTAKSASNGQPFGFMLMPKKIAESAYPLSMITTNSSNGGLLRAVVVARLLQDEGIQSIIDQNAKIIDEVAANHGINLRGRRMNRGIETDSKDLIKIIQWHLFLQYGILVGALPATVRFQPMILEHPATIRNITEATCRGIKEVLANVELGPDGKITRYNSKIIPDEVVISYNNSTNPSGLNR